MKLQYNEKDINQILQVLDILPIQGIQHMNNILIAFDILKNPVKVIERDKKEENK